jgi:DNA polymerase III subunit beta
MPSTLEKTTTLLFDRKAMLDALKDVAGIIPARSPKPILLQVLLTVHPYDGATLAATDLEVGIRRRVLGVKAEGRAELVLPPGRLGEILRGAADDEVALEIRREDKVTIRGRRWHFTLPTEDPSLFPSVPGFAAADHHAVAPAELRRAIRRTIYATDLESTRYALGGVLVEAGDDALTFVATDGRRLARQAVDAERVGKGFGGRAAVIPAKALKLIDRSLDDDGALALVAADASAAYVRTDDATIYTRLVEGRFPRYQDVFPAAHESVVTVAVGALLDAATQAAIVTDETTRGVDFAFAGGTLKLSASAADVGEGETEVEITTLSGPAVTLTLDPRYLTEMLRALDREAVLRIELVDDKNAVILKAEDRFDGVIMVLTRDR